MGYSIQTRSSADSALRTGVHDSLDNAKRDVYLGDDERPYAAAIFESESASFDQGKVVSVFDPSNGWIDVEEVAQPLWWEKVPENARRWLLEHHGEDLPSEVWIPVVQSGGSVYSIQWDNSDPTGMMLTISDEEWLRFRRAVEALA